MAASSQDDIPKQLATLLGIETVRIRKTDEEPPKVSVIDVAVAVTGHDANYAGQAVRNVCEKYPDVHEKVVYVKFPDARGRMGQKTPVADVKGIVEIIMLLQGHHAAMVRRQAAELLCRWLGGDLRIIDEVCRIRGFQEVLAAHRPDDPRRVFGLDVEAAPVPDGTVGEQLARMLTTVNQRLTTQEQLLTRIHERIEHDQQRVVNLNVRAPKRAAARQPQLAGALVGVGRPFPVARFLDCKEREDPTWKSVRRSFAPTFGMQVQVLKKKKLKEEGRPPAYVVQNHRPQLLYTDEDRAVMQEAWELTAAHREDLAGRGPQEEALVAHNRPTVIDMLRGGHE